MKTIAVIIIAGLFAIVSFAQTEAEQNIEIQKGKIQVINQSKKYTVVDNIFKLEQQFGDSTKMRFDTETENLVEAGSYLVKINFYARWGIYSNDGILTKKIEVKPGKTVKVYLVGGDYSGIYATDPKIEIDE
jgi:hypothetical protein